MPKFKENINHIPPTHPCSLKQCNNSAPVKFHLELLLTTMNRKKSRSGVAPSAYRERIGRNQIPHAL